MGAIFSNGQSFGDLNRPDNQFHVEYAAGTLPDAWSEGDQNQSLSPSDRQFG